MAALEKKCKSEELFACIFRRGNVQKLWSGKGKILENSVENPAARNFFSQPVECGFREKVEFLSDLLRTAGICVKTFQPSFQHAVETLVEMC